MTEIWNFLLVHPLISLLVLVYGAARDFGIAIVVVTIGIRLLLYPLFVAQIRSQRAMQELGPAMNEIRERYGKDRQKLTEEQMKLYKERGYNPASGCLPLIVQMPILFAMYAAFIQAPSLTGELLRPPDGTGAILWPFVPNPVPAGETLDLAAHWLPWVTGGLGHPDPLFILPILAGATQLISSVMAMPFGQKPSTDPQARMMQSMSYYFPLITVVIAWSLPAGLSLYWVATTVFQIVQQYVVTGWGQLARFLPFLHRIPTPADRTLRARQAEAVVEAEHDMRAKGVRPSEGPGAQRAEASRAGEDDAPRQSRSRSARKKRRR
jgi:YidC/Oxa1 family membrane protein insertase